MIFYAEAAEDRLRDDGMRDRWALAKEISLILVRILTRALKKRTLLAILWYRRDEDQQIRVQQILLDD